MSVQFSAELLAEKARSLIGILPVITNVLFFVLVLVLFVVVAPSFGL